MSVREGVASDGDYIIDNLTLGSVALGWLPKSRHQTKRSEFFRYFTTEIYHLEIFQVF